MNPLCFLYYCCAGRHVLPLGIMQSKLFRALLSWHTRPLRKHRWAGTQQHRPQGPAGCQQDLQQRMHAPITLHCSYPFSAANIDKGEDATVEACAPAPAPARALAVLPSKVARQHSFLAVHLQQRTNLGAWAEFMQHTAICCANCISTSTRLVLCLLALWVCLFCA
jgi:hypothetical protein